MCRARSSYPVPPNPSTVLHSLQAIIRKPCVAYAAAVEPEAVVVRLK